MFVFRPHRFLGKSVGEPEVNVSTEKTPMGNDHPCPDCMNLYSERMRERSGQLLRVCPGPRKGGGMGGGGYAPED